MESQIEVSGFSRTPKFNYLRVTMKMVYNEKIKKTLTLNSLINFFDSALNALKNSPELCDTYSNYKIGSKIIISNFERPAYIEFLNKDILNASLIIDRISMLFQSGKISDIDFVSITFSVLGKIN